MSNYKMNIFILVPVFHPTLVSLALGGVLSLKTQATRETFNLRQFDKEGGQKIWLRIGAENAILACHG